MCDNCPDAENDDHAGGVPSTDPLATDAGLAGALAMFTAMEEMEQVVDIDIAGATVTATNFGTGGNANFWVQDSGGAMQVFLGFMNPVERPRSSIAANKPSANVVLPRFIPVAAR